MKKVLFMLSSMNIGGVEKSLLSLLSTMEKDKYDVTVLLLEKKGGFLEMLPEWVKVEEAIWFKEIQPIIMQSPYQTIQSFIKKFQWIKGLRFLYGYMMDQKGENRLKYYEQIMRWIPELSGAYDIAIAYAAPTEIIDFYITHKVKSKKKISWIHFDVSKFTINKNLYKSLLVKFDKVFVVSNEAEKRLVEALPTIKGKTEVFLNIISSDLIKRMSEEPIEFDNEYNGMKIVTVGRLSKEKGQDLAIRALFKLKKERYDVKWYCIGDGNSRNDFEDLIKELELENDFILLGATCNPYPYMKNADIYVQTSRHEGFCLTLAEAKALKKPIITTDFITAYEQIEHNENGLIAEANEDSIYENIKYLINNQQKLKDFSVSLSRENLNETKEVDKLLKLIK